MLEEEPDRLGGGVRALRVGVGANRTTAVPGMAAAVDNPGLRDLDPVEIVVHGAGVGAPAVTARRHRRILACDVACREPGGDQLVCVDRSHDRVLVAMDDDQRHRAGRGRCPPVRIAAKADPTSCAARYAIPECTPTAAYRSG